MPAGPTVFGYPVALPPECEEASTYTFFLDRGEAPQRGRPPGLRSSLVVARVAQDGRPLDRFMDEQRQVMTQKLPSAKLVREGKTKLGQAPAHEREYHFLADSPLPSMVQWHVCCAREGWFYLFCATSPRERFERDRKAFRAILDSWA